MVRVVKSINDLLPKPVPGFLIECLIWNVPNYKFGNQTYEEDLRNCLVYLFEELAKPASDEWGGGW